MRILVTRPAEDAAPLAAALAARGHTPRLEAMLEIATAAEARGPLDLDGVQAILFTSANGVRAFARLSARRDLPVFAVGDASARAAREAGFARIESAEGDVGDLARLVAQDLHAAHGDLFHGAARSVAGDLKGALEAAGFTLRRAVLYEARPAVALSPGTRTALSQGEIDAAAFFSPRTAQTFVDLVKGADLAAACASIDAVCLSAAVAEKLRVLSWRSVRIAARPNQEALLACIDGMARRDDAAASEGTMSADDTSEDKAGPGTDAPNAEPEAQPKAEARAEAGAHDIIARFGGIRPMASKLGVAVSTVQGWRERASIPSARHHQILAAAEAHKIEIDAEVLAASDRAPDGHGEAEGAPGREAAGEAPSEAAGPTPSAPARWIPESGKTPTGEKARENDARKDAPAAPEVSPPQGDAKAAERGSRGGAWMGAFLVAAIVFAVGAGAAVLTRDAWTPYLAAAPADDPNAARIDTLERRLAELAAEPAEDPNAARIEALESQVAEIAARPAPSLDETGLAEARSAIADLRGALAGLESRLETLDEIARAGTNPEELSAALARLDARYAELADQVTGEAAAVRADLAGMAEARAPAPASESAMALAVLQMRDALRGAEPYEAALSALEATAADIEGAEAVRDAVAPLRPYAAAGAPSLESLRAAFPAVARAVIAQAHGGEGDGIWANAVRRLSGLVSVRPLGPVEGDSAEAIVARAESQLEAGDLGSALRELDALGGPAAEAAAGWRGEAEARLAAQAALERLGGLLAAGRVADRG